MGSVQAHFNNIELMALTFAYKVFSSGIDIEKDEYQVSKITA